MSHKIVAYKQEYHHKLVNIWYEAVRLTHTFLSEENIEFYRSMVDNEALQQTEVWIELGEDGAPTGFIGLDDHKIEMLFVDPSCHGKGVGTRLIKYAQSIKGIDLSVDVNEQNEGAHGFYTRYGFVRVGRSERDGSGQPFPILHLTYNK
ncbi:GNAT family N-acetyltransferase [Paenibacillaceae bacterium]|nr:GNAT family N-acetyltransferase [Paenibacillaceae bacterium]